MRASYRGHERVVTLLIERGADIDMQDYVRILFPFVFISFQSGKSALQIARHLKKTNCIRVLEINQIWTQRKHFLIFNSQLSNTLASSDNVNVVRVNVLKVLELEEMKREITIFF